MGRGFRLALAAVVTGVVASAGGAGLAQAKVTTGPGGELHGCVSKKGVMRVIKFTGSCPRHEQSIKFGARGPAGPKGATGAPGATSPSAATVATDPSGASDPSADESEIQALQSQVATLNIEVSALQSTLAGVSREGSTLRFSGMNLQLESGSGSTGTVNGLGNLIIGYNENPGTQTGSNNLVVGNGQSFTSYGGIVAGHDNTISGPFASVSGGEGNTASGDQAAISGGEYNLASDPFSFIGGGCDNLAGTGIQPASSCSDTGVEALVGGDDNQADHQFAMAGACDGMAGMGSLLPTPAFATTAWTCNRSPVATRTRRTAKTRPSPAARETSLRASTRRSPAARSTRTLTKAKAHRARAARKSFSGAMASTAPRPDRRRLARSGRPARPGSDES